MTDFEPRTPSLAGPSSSAGAPIWVTVMVGLISLSMGLGVSFLLRSHKQTAPVVSPCASAAASASTPKVEPGQLERAAAGETQAMDDLLALTPEQRTLEQALALSKGRAVQKHMALDLLSETLSKSVEPDGLKKLMQFAQEGDTARTAIGIAAGLSGAKGADLLYELSIAKGTAPEMALLASQFLSSKSVRAKAGPALALVLDLRDATECQARRSLLEKAIEIGDKRLVRHIVPLTKKTGCGAKKADDCNPCLRDDNQKIIREAMAKSQARKSPAF